jgi:cathepsin L
MVNPEPGLGTQEEFPYQYATKTPDMLFEPRLSCPVTPEPLEVTAQMTGYYALSNGNEEVLKAFVSEHGAAISALHANSREFKDYRAGIFDGCEPGEKIDHAVLVVGFGTEDDVDYWLIKNSWGTDWGDQGCMKIQRGVKMCGIGQHIAYVTCEAQSGYDDPEPVEYDPGEYYYDPEDPEYQ